MNRQILISTLIMSFLILATIGVITYGRGYRFGLDNGKPDLSGTGLLVATSKPNGASVYINESLTTATDNTINLSPGSYDVKVVKEGYFPWRKQIKVQKEVVSKAEVLLFSKTPKLENITAAGIEEPIMDPSMTKIAYKVSSQSAKKNGIYILDTNAKPILTLQSASIQIADDTFNDFSKSSLSWSPDGKELIATISGQIRGNTYLLSASGFNENPKDVTESLSEVEILWQKDKEDKEKSRLSGLNLKLQKVISDDFKIISWSPDETKILYEASTSTSLPLIINPRLIGVDSTEEERNIKKGSVYVYDTKEDKNFKLGVEIKIPNPDGSESSRVLSWLPDSNHILYVSNRKINIMDYDGINSVTVYAGPFSGNYVFPWSNVSKVIMLTDLNNPDILPNLYTIGLQ